jgi:predicted nucleic acid-binding protein
VPFVLDASVAASWFLQEVDHPHVGLAWEMVRAEPATVPTIWWYEIRNLLLMAERRKRLSSADAETAWQKLRLLRIEMDTIPDEQRSLGFARRHTLSFYDAAYLELAQRLGYPLATRDHALARAAKHERVSLIDEIP